VSSDKSSPATASSNTVTVTGFEFLTIGLHDIVPVLVVVSKRLVVEFTIKTD